MNAMISAYLHAEQIKSVDVEAMFSSFRPDAEALQQRKRSPGHNAGGAVPRETTMIGDHEGREIRCTSDGAFILKSQRRGDQVLFNIEYDRGYERIPSRDGIDGMTSDSIEGKCRLFVQFLNDGTMRHVFGDWMSAYVLFIAPDTTRIDAMMQGVRWRELATVAGHDPRSFFRFTTEREAERAFLGPIWRQPGLIDGRGDLIRLPLAKGAA